MTRIYPLELKIFSNLTTTLVIPAFIAGIHCPTRVVPDDGARRKIGGGAAKQAFSRFDG